MRLEVDNLVERFLDFRAGLRRDVGGAPTDHEPGLADILRVDLRKTRRVAPQLADDEVVALVRVEVELAYLGGYESGAALIQRLAKEGSLKKTCIDLKVELRKARGELAQLKARFGVESFREGWIPSEFENIGEWQPVTESPEEVLESYFPLFPLFADPKAENHSGDGKTIYFGVLPTSSRDTDENGNARFVGVAAGQGRFAQEDLH